ncbi:Putative Gpi anchored serine-rich protein [[Torrubiella] hemipterigena]|uniref:Putative Gpi anchored serine-rich protein n=1 Tax=[Torrubiella] hemipterigena TaxID=1531966 RepID=A0A0A1TCW0_9HYPO|nr:Putative Gpi anchored serine-rich protein [[Torrubiella] hemipterigena]
MLKSSIALLLGASVGVHACSTPVANAATVEFVSGFEGWRDYVYRDPGNGFQTLGYGHLCKKPNCAEVPYKFPPLSKADGLKLLSSDMAIAENCVTKDIKDKIVLNANQYGALVSWAFNVGCGNVASSSLIRRLNAGENPNVVAASELPKWNKDAKGHVLPGLTRRRAAEVKLFQTPTSEHALPACQNPGPPKSTSKPAPPATHSKTQDKPTSTETKTKPSHSETKGTHTETTIKPTSPQPSSTTLPTAANSTLPSNWNTSAIPTSVPMTTSIVWTTSIHMVISCAPTVTNCPAHSTVLVTETVPAYTTVCPVTETEKVQSGQLPVATSLVPTTTSVTVVVPPAQSANTTLPTAPVAAGASTLSLRTAVVAAALAAVLM